MRRRLTSALAGLIAIPLAATAVLAAPFPARVDLAGGWAPEGIAAGPGTTAYVGSLSTGGVARLDLRNGEVEDDFIPGVAGTVAVGLEYEAGAERLWVAGGPGQQVRVYDASNGDLLETYQFTSGFVNDVVVTPEAVYATDSNMPQVLVMPLGDDGSLPDPADAVALPISGDFAYQAGFNANGIAALAGWLIVPQSNTGELFAIDPHTGASIQLLGEGSIPSADGLELVGSTLYVVVRGAAFTGVEVHRFHGGAVAFQGRIPSDDLDVPTTVAFAAGRLWVANARFGTPVTPDTEYWITGLPTR
ncbi:MAG: superoxide dismutase [Chloroflexota bacterium]|nr:MAG: superoxide dismutase [Chloroflexota bacterium]